MVLCFFVVVIIEWRISSDFLFASERKEREREKRGGREREHMMVYSLDPVVMTRMMCTPTAPTPTLSFRLLKIFHHLAPVTPQPVEAGCGWKCTVRL